MPLKFIGMYSTRLWCSSAVYYSNVGSDIECWIGLYKSIPEAWDNVTYWLDGNPSKYRNWAADEPNSAYQCVNIVASVGVFRDKPCDSGYRYTCKCIYILSLILFGSHWDRLAGYPSFLAHVKFDFPFHTRGSDFQLSGIGPDWLTLLKIDGRTRPRDPRHGWPCAGKYTVSQKRDPDIIDCDFKKDWWFLTIFGTNIPETTGHQTAVQFPTSPNICFYTTWGKQN